MSETEKGWVYLIDTITHVWYTTIILRTIFILECDIMSSKTVGELHKSIMRRCYDHDYFMYQNYGRKGITVYDKWHNKEEFASWLKDNNYVTGAKLKRIDTSLGYYPDNCIVTNIPEKRKRKEINGIPEYLVKQAKAERRKQIRESYGVPKSYSKLRIHRCYNGMVHRCTLHKNSNGNSEMLCRKYYISRGITVCDEWLGETGFYEFYNWAMKNGYSDDLTLDRIDNDKGYYPENCRWVTAKDQVRNRRNNVRYNYHGEQLLLIEICEKENISYDALKYRVVKRGQDIDYAISEIRKRSERMNELHDSNINPVGCTIRKIREKTGLTQKSFCKKYKIPDKIFQSWEEGKCDALKIISYLLKKLIKVSDEVA